MKRMKISWTTCPCRQATAATAVLLLFRSSAHAFFAPIPRTATVMRVAGIESTPNPCSFKFDLDEAIVDDKGSGRSSSNISRRGITFDVGNAAAAPQMVMRLLELDGVESVYAMDKWLCLNKDRAAKWDSIVPAAVQALGGPNESFDPMLLAAAVSRGDQDSASVGNQMDGIEIRLQVSHGIPIQVEACPSGGTPLRRKLSSRFVDAMNEFVSSSGDEMAFFKGRQWLPRGVRYPDHDRAMPVAESAEEALALAVDEVELAYHESRLRGAVADALMSARRSSAGSGVTAEETAAAAVAAAAAATADVKTAAAALLSPANKDVIAAVDRLCMMAGSAPASHSQDTGGKAAREALDALVGFAASGFGPVPARRSAVAFIGGVGEAAGDQGLDAVVAVFRGDKSPGVRRTAGDAMSDLGEPAAVPVAIAGLHDKSKLVRWRAARIVGELGTRELEADALDEAREGESEFEVAFEMSDAARKVRSRVAGAAAGVGQAGEAKLGAAAGPVWRQIRDSRGGA